jgi:hypothetical protein
MGKKPAVVVASLHEKLFDPQAIQTSWVVELSECKFTGPNKNKNNFTCLLLYNFYMIYIIRNPILWLGISVYFFISYLTIIVDY